jgi:hypothetical protein
LYEHKNSSPISARFGLNQLCVDNPSLCQPGAAGPESNPVIAGSSLQVGVGKGCAGLAARQQGNAPAKQFTVTVDTYNPYATQTINYSVAIRQLDPGKSYNVGFVTAFQLPDSPCFKARADVYQTVVEANESNNQLISSGPVNLPCYVTWPG